MASMISDLLKTPQQLREAQLDKLRALGQTNAQNALLAGRGGSAISGAIAGLAAQGQSILPETMEGAKRGGLLGIGNIAQALGAEGLGQSLQTAAVPAAERAAAAQQQAIKGANTSSVEGLRATAQKLREAGNTAVALKLEEMASKREAEEIKIKLDERTVGVQEEKLELSKKDKEAKAQSTKEAEEVKRNFISKYTDDKSIIEAYAKGVITEDKVSDLVPGLQGKESKFKADFTEIETVQNGVTGTLVLKNGKPFGFYASGQKPDVRELSKDNNKVLNIAIEDNKKAVNAQSQAENLYSELSKIDNWSGGFITGIKESFKKLTGNRDLKSYLVTEVTNMRNTGMLKNLPPGAASDPDIQLVLAGEIPDEAGKEETLRFLNGITKINKANAKYNLSKARWLSEHRDLGGFLDHTIVTNTEDFMSGMPPEVNKIIEGKNPKVVKEVLKRKYNVDIDLEQYAISIENLKRQGRYKP